MKMSEIFKKTLSALLCAVLIAACAAVTTGCGDDKDSSKSSSKAETTAAAEIQESPDEDKPDESQSDGAQTVGTGAVQFTFNVTDKDGNVTPFTVNTDKKTVGEALTENGLIDGDQSDYGLYVTTVNGTKLDFNTDGYYWAFYVDGKYAEKGVDSTDVKAGSTYEFKAEKAQ